MPVLLGRAVCGGELKQWHEETEGRYFSNIHSNTQTQQIYIRRSRSLCWIHPAIHSFIQPTKSHTVLYMKLGFLQIFNFRLKYPFSRHLSPRRGVNIWVCVWSITPQLGVIIHSDKWQHVKCKWAAKKRQLMLKSFSGLFHIHRGP